jgi:hypothetical protein
MTGSALGLATGGFVSGPGSPTSDSIPAMLSNGEYVMNAEAVKKFGTGFLDAMNEGRVPHKASGGLMLAPRISLPRAANSNNPMGGHTFNINVAAPNTGNPQRDRKTSLQQATDIRKAIASALVKGAAA